MSNSGNRPYKDAIGKWRMDGSQTSLAKSAKIADEAKIPKMAETCLYLLGPVNPIIKVLDASDLETA